MLAVDPGLRILEVLVHIKKPDMAQALPLLLNEAHEVGVLPHRADRQNQAYLPSCRFGFPDHRQHLRRQIAENRLRIRHQPQVYFRPLSQVPGRDLIVVVHSCHLQHIDSLSLS